MKLNSLNSYKSGFDITKNLVLAIAIFFIVFMALTIYYTNQEIKKARNTVIVIDKKSGQLIDSETQQLADTREIEYAGQVRLAYNLWYSFDENNYDSNIEEAMYIFGDCGSEMLNQYNDEGVKSMVMEKNIRFSVRISNVSINMGSNPVTGTIEGTQTITRSKAKMTRNLFCKFTITDCNRSDHNAHGCKLDNWEIYNKEKIR